MGRQAIRVRNVVAIESMVFRLSAEQAILVVAKPHVLVKHTNRQLGSQV